MAERDYLGEIAALSQTLSGIEEVLDLPKLKVEAEKLEIEAGATDLWNNPENAQKVTSKLSHTQAQINKLISLRRRIEDLPVLLELATEAGDKSAFAEADIELDAITKVLGELEVQTLLSGEYDERDALITIRSEAGGVEACDWAEMISRMYLRYCERHGYKVDVLDTSYGEEAGIKLMTFRVSAAYASEFRRYTESTLREVIFVAVVLIV